MELGLKGKVAIITGASRGIGRAIAAGLLAEGANVSICARDAKRLSSTADELQRSPQAKGRVHAIPLDITDAAACKRLVEETVAEFGRLDILVNNAGGSMGSGPFLSTDEEGFRKVWELNTMSGLRLARLAIPHMRSTGGGAIIFIASIWGREAGGSPAYNMAKAATISLSKSLARELAPLGIRVNSIAPGSVLHPGGSWERRMKADPEGVRGFVASEIPIGRFGRPEEIANVAVFLASERASLVTGACINVDGGQSRSLI